MEETLNYKFKKQDELDFYNVNLVNENLDTIDLAIKEAKDTADSKASSTHTHDASDINGIATDAESTSFDNSTSDIFSTNVQSAVEEVNDKTNANKTSILNFEEKVENVSMISNKIHSMVDDINKINFELKINNYITSENMKHVFVDTIDSASDVILTFGMFNSGKVYI